MGIFSKRAKQPAHRLTAMTTDGLAEYGRAVANGTEPPDSFDRFVWPAYQAMQADRAGTIGEISAAAQTAGGWALFGGHRLIMEASVSPYDDPTHLAVMDAALLVLQEQGYSSGRLNRVEVDRWLATRGSLRVFDGLDLAIVPQVGEEPPVTPLGAGEVRRLTSQFDTSDTPFVEVEQRPDGTFVAVSEGPSDEGPGARFRFEWFAAPSYEELLRELGDRMVAPPAWAHPDLMPYFPWQPPSS